MPHDYYITPDDYKLAKSRGINAKTLESRVYQHGWSKKRALQQPPREYNRGCEYLKRARENGIKSNTYHMRLARGWSKEKASTTPPQRVNNKKHLDKIRTKSQAKRRKYPDYVYDNLKNHGIKRGTFYHRVNVLGWTIKDACTTPTGSGEVNNSNHIWRKYTQVNISRKVHAR